MTTGYIVSCNNQCLTRDYRWIPRRAESAFVFPDWQIADVLELAEGFKVKPTHIIPAEYSDGVVTVTGEPMGRVEG